MKTHISLWNPKRFELNLSENQAKDLLTCHYIHNTNRFRLLKRFISDSSDNLSSPLTKHYQALIIGGGTTGIMTAAQFIRQKKSNSIAIIEPTDTHYYQPAFTLVGAGTYSFDKTAKPMADMIPKGTQWIKDSSKEHWRLWIFKKFLLSLLYWKGMMKGRNV